MLVNSFSKYFSTTGSRIGWLVLPDDLVRPVECLAQNLFISAPYISQVAAEAAFDCEAELQANIARYLRSRDHLLAALPVAGFARLSPAEGAFYLFAEISDRSNDSAGFCARMLLEAGVAASPGVDFDRTRGTRFVRFSYCGPEADMRQATQRLRGWRQRGRETASAGAEYNYPPTPPGGGAFITRCVSAAFTSTEDRSPTLSRCAATHASAAL